MVLEKRLWERSRLLGGFDTKGYGSATPDILTGSAKSVCWNLHINFIQFLGISIAPVDLDIGALAAAFTLYGKVFLSRDSGLGSCLPPGAPFFCRA